MPGLSSWRSLSALSWTTPRSGSRQAWSKLGSESSLDVDLDDLVFFNFKMAAGSTCLLADGFDVGQPDSLWVNGSSFTVTAAAALQGEGGLAAPLGSDIADSMLTAVLPAQDDRLGVRFRFNPNGVALAANSRAHLLRAVTATGGNVFSVVLAPAASGYVLTVLEGSAGTQFWIPAAIPIENLPQEITLDWQRSASSNVALGALRLWIDGKPKVELTGLANAGLEVADIQLGAHVFSAWGGEPPALLGTVYLDDFAVVRGPHP